MRLELTGRHLDITPTLRRLVTTNVAKLERLLNDNAVSAHVVLVREKHRHVTEITLHARGEQFLHAVGDTGNWQTSLSAAIEKLAHQAVKLKDKRQARTHRRGKAGSVAFAEQGAPEMEAPSRAPARTSRVRTPAPRVLRASRQAIKAMSVADAASAIDGSRDGIIVFLDTDTASINVLYRRHDGELTLVEIEI